MKNLLNDDGILTVIILTYNEEIHIERAILNAKKITNNIIVIDSGSNDQTINIVNKYQIKLVIQSFATFSDKLNWCISELEITTPWVIRLDADECFYSNFLSNFRNLIKIHDSKLSAIYVNRELFFMSKPIKFGGYYPNYSIRIWKNRSVLCETRYLDEHIIVKEGYSIYSNLKIIDNPLYPLTKWILKHNNYAYLEAKTYLESIYKKSENIEIHENLFGKSIERKKWLKNSLYYKLPIFLRCYFYFFYRFILRLGFLDGIHGFIFHSLHSFWYRYLIDSIIYENKMKNIEN